jgi:hypothetical protein
MPDDCNDPDRTLPCAGCCPGFAYGFETKIISAEVFKHGFSEFVNNDCVVNVYLLKTWSSPGAPNTNLTTNPQSGCIKVVYGDGAVAQGDISPNLPVNFGGFDIDTSPTSQTYTAKAPPQGGTWSFTIQLSNEHTTAQLLSTLESRVQSICDFESIEFGQNRKVDYVRLPPNPPIPGGYQPCYEATYEPQCVYAGFNFSGSAHKTLSLDEISASAQKIEYRIFVERPIGYCSKDGPVTVKWRQRTKVSTREECTTLGDPETTYEDFEESITFPEGEPEDGFLYLSARSETYAIDVPAEIDTVVDVVGLPARASAGIGLSYKSASLTKFGFPAFTQSPNAPRFFKKAEVTGQFAGCPELNIEPRDYGNTFTANSPLYWQLPRIQSATIGFAENVFRPTYYPTFMGFPDKWEQYASDLNLPPLIEETETKRVWKSVIKCGEQDVEHRIELNLSEEVTSGTLQAELNEYLDSEDTYSSGYFENSATEHDLYISKTNSAKLFVSLSIPYAFSDDQSFDAVVRKRTTNTLTGEMSVVQEKFKFDFAAGETYKEKTTDISEPPSNTRIEYKVFEEDQETHNLFTLPGVDVQWSRKMNVPINPKTGWEL